MSQYSLKIPNSLFEAAKMLAKKEDISLNELFTTAIAEKLSALDTLETLTALNNVNKLLMDKLAKSSARQRYQAVLAKVKDNPVIAGDEILPKSKSTKAKKSSKRK